MLESVAFNSVFCTTVQYLRIVGCKLICQWLTERLARPLLAGSRSTHHTQPSQRLDLAANTAATAAGTDTTPLDCSALEFSSLEEHHAHMEGQSKLPLGFRVGTDDLNFVSQEVPKKVTMNVTAIVLDEVYFGGVCVYHVDILHV